MNPSQKKAATAKIREIVLSQEEEQPNDAVSVRTSAKREENMINFQVECRVTCADDEYDSGWYWAGGFSVGPRGKIY